MNSDHAHIPAGGSQPPHGVEIVTASVIAHAERRRAGVAGAQTVSCRRPGENVASLNWISVPAVRRICRTLGVHPVLRSRAPLGYVERGHRRELPTETRRDSVLSTVLQTFDRLAGVALCKGVLPSCGLRYLSCWIVRENVLGI